MRITIPVKAFGFILAILLIAGSYYGFSQCVQTVSFTNWRSTGDSAGGGTQWVLGTNDTSVQSQYNTFYPQFFVGPDTFMNVRITGKFRVGYAGDDDYVGFVFGFKETWNYPWWVINDSMRHEYYLFDWKRNTQNYIGYVAQEGFSLNEVDRTFARNIPNVFPSFWNHTNSGTFQVLQTQYSATNGWVPNQTYDFELYLVPTRAVIVIDSDTIFDEPGCFEPGLFGFYSFSQQNTLYWDFDYELFIDFAMDAEDVCLGDTAKFVFIDTAACNGTNAFSNIDTFYWDLGDGTLASDTNPIHIYDSAGQYTVYLVATDLNGCTDTAERVISIQAKPDAILAFDDVCFGDSAQIFDSTVMALGYVETWDWDFGDGNTDTVEHAVSHLYAQSGTYSIELIIHDNAGCIDTVDSSITIFDRPDIDFIINDTCDGIAIQFEDVSTSTNGLITERIWDVNNDGTNDYFDSIQVSYTYSGHGIHTAQLVVVDEIGCSDSLYKLVNVFPHPEADFEAPSVCNGVVTLFFDSSDVATGQINSWSWDFGSATSQIQNPQYQFDTSGIKTVKLHVTTQFGCTDSLSKSVVVYHDPIPYFEISDACQYLELHIDQQSVSPHGQIVGYDWSFGDGGISTSPTPIYAYDTAGIFNVGLTIVTEYGCTANFLDSVRIYPGPKADFRWDNNVCEGDELAFYDLTTIAQVTPGGDLISNWSWEFNERISQQQNPSFLTIVHEEIRTKLIVTSNYGCKDSVTQYPNVFPLPVADYTVDLGCQEGESFFKDQSTVEYGIVDQWLWDFGDGFTSTEPDPVHDFQNAGSNTVNLKIKTTYECANEITRTHHIAPKPNAKFSITDDIGCSPFDPWVVNRSEIDSGSLTYKWYVDQELISQQRTPKFLVYNDSLEPSMHAIKLTAISNEGCEDAYKKDSAFTVLPVPKSGIRVLKDEVDMFKPIVSFENDSRHAIRWFWSFGDGRSSDDFAPQYTYTNSGSYMVQLVSWNEFNCPDTARKQLEVDPVTTLYVPSAFTPNGDGHNEVFGVQGFSEGKHFEIIIWDRWGHIIFESKDFNFTWDGRLSDNKLAPCNKYVFQILFEQSTGEFKEIHGNVALIR